MKEFEIEPNQAEEDQTQAESVYHVTLGGDPVICLSDDEANGLLPLNYSQG